MAEGNGRLEAYKWVAVLVISALVSYFTTTGALSSRLAVAESRIDRMGEDLREIKADVKRVLEAVR